MKALAWHGRGDIRCDTVPDPKIQDGRDAIIKVTACAICGSDLHLMGGYVPTMEKGDVLGHETMGEVVEVGKDNTKLKVGDRVVVPFTICCGECRQCKWGNWSCCERSNPNAAMQAKVLGFPSAGMFGYSHLTGGIPGGQAEYLRVPYADVGPVKVPEGLADEQVLFLTDIFPTAYMAAEHCDITPEDTIAIWGCGPVGILCIKSCFLLGAKRVIAIDRVPERLALARKFGRETIDSNESNVHEALMEMTKGQGPDAVVECVGLESHGANSLVERAAAAVQSTVSAIERPYALNECIMACRPGGIVSVPGVYIGPVGPVMMGAFMNKSLTMRTGQTHMLRYIEPLMKRIQDGEIDPSFIITHRSTKLEDGPALYETFREKKDGCIKVVLKPHG